jgi:hypothetical protein
MFLPYRLKVPDLTDTTNNFVLRDGYLNAHFAWRRGRTLLTYLHALGLGVVLCSIAGHLIHGMYCTFGWKQIMEVRTFSFLLIIPF